MYSNNIVVDYENLIKIPQNSNSYYKIFKSYLISNSIEVGIFPYEEIDILNLFLIVKSYSSSLIYPPSFLLILIRNKGSREFVAYSSGIREFKNISYYGFEKWFYNKLYHDWEYLRDDSEYSIIFTYPLALFDMDLLPFLKPSYPWKSEILEKLTGLKEDESYYLMTIESQKKEINAYKKKIESLLKEIEEYKTRK